MAKFKIGTPTITRPNMMGEVIKETPKQLHVRVTSILPDSKTSATGITHKFTEGELEWFSSQIGRTLKFWKADKGEVSGGSKLIEL